MDHVYPVEILVDDSTQSIPLSAALFKIAMLKCKTNNTEVAMSARARKAREKRKREQAAEERRAEEEEISAMPRDSADESLRRTIENMVNASVKEACKRMTSELSGNDRAPRFAVASGAAWSSADTSDRRTVMIRPMQGMQRNVNDRQAESLSVQVTDTSHDS